MDIEIWKPWRNGDYEVSNHGNVRRAKSTARAKAGNNLKKTLLKIGYYKVSPVIKGKNVLHYVHRMVAECFIGMPENGVSVNHIDGVKTNNHISKKLL